MMGFLKPQTPIKEGLPTDTLINGVFGWDFPGLFALPKLARKKAKPTGTSGKRLERSLPQIYVYSSMCTAPLVKG